MADKALLKCKIENGLFPDEVTVLISTKNAGEVSLFCPKDFIKSEKLEIWVLEKSGEDVLIKLPAESALGTTFVVATSSLLEGHPV